MVIRSTVFTVAYLLIIMCEFYLEVFCYWPCEKKHIICTSLELLLLGTVGLLTALLQIGSKTSTLQYYNILLLLYVQLLLHSFIGPSDEAIQLLLWHSLLQWWKFSNTINNCFLNNLKTYLEILLYCFIIIIIL